MTKIKNGFILIAAGVGLNIFGRLAMRFLPAVPSLLVWAFALTCIAFASIVLVLFGFFRLIVGLVTRKKQTSASPVIVADDSVWPPAPKPPDSH